MSKKSKREPVPGAVRAEAFASYTCAFWCDQPMVGTARDVDGAILPTCGQHGKGNK